MTPISVEVKTGWKIRVLGLLAFGLAMISAVGATSLNDSIYPVLQGITLLFTPLLAVILAAIPVIVAVAIIAFIIGILMAIEGKLKI